MTRLAESLSDLNTELRPVMKYVADKYTEKEYADPEREFYSNRDKANEMIRSGQFPAGASPYWQRGLQRASLKQHGALLTAQLQQGLLMGEDGAEARGSNDPRVVQQFTDKVTQKYIAENLQANGKSLYSSLDMQEIFNPAIEQAGRSVLTAHAIYRVKENQQQYIDLAGASIETLLDEHITDLKETDSDEKRGAAYREAGKKINDVLYDHDTGLVKNGLAPSQGNQLIVDSVVAKALKTGSRAYLDVLDNISVGNGSVARTQYAQAKRLQAEERLTSLQIQEENHQWAQEQRPYQREALHRQVEEWKMQDDRWERERQGWQQQDANKAETEIYRSLMRRTYEGINSSNSRRGVSIINEAIRTAEQVLPEKAESLRSLVAAAHTRQVHQEDDPKTVAQIYLDMGRDPLAFDENRLAREVKAGNLTVSTMRGIFDDLDRKRNNASHPMLRQPEFSEMLHQVQKGALQSPEDEFSASGQLRAATAIADFRDRANDWLATHPKGSAEAFRVYMRSQLEPVIEGANRDYGREVEAERKKQVTEGQRIVGEGQAAHKQKQTEMVKDIKSFTNEVDAAQRQRELERLKQHESQPRIGENAFTQWLRGERKSTFEGPRMGTKTDRFLNWIAGIKQEPEVTAKQEPIKAESFGKLLNAEQRKAVMGVAPGDRRAALVQLLGPLFMQNGESVQDLQREVDRFISKLPK
jgi:hypothetical protein